MKNKTCGECKHLNRDLAFCRACGAKWISVKDVVNCKYFEEITQPTNGDRIRQMSNEELAEMLVYPVKPINVNGNIYYEFTSCLLLGKSYPMREQAVFLTERQLNAPAESEGEDE